MSCSIYIQAKSKSKINGGEFVGETSQAAENPGTHFSLVENKEPRVLSLRFKYGGEGMAYRHPKLCSQLRKAFTQPNAVART